jgi:hypothetical protein
MKKVIIKHLYYRNVAVVNNIEPGALWRLNGKMLQLVDDDQYVAVNFEENKTLFYQVEI